MGFFSLDWSEYKYRTLWSSCTFIEFLLWTDKKKFDIWSRLWTSFEGFDIDFVVNQLFREMKKRDINVVGNECLRMILTLRYTWRNHTNMNINQRLWMMFWGCKRNTSMEVWVDSRRRHSVIVLWMRKWM